MYTPGKLLYFDPFHFANGGQKPKYFLVIKNVGGNLLLASLPSSKAHLPSQQPIQHGCLEVPDSGINCYIFEASRPITQCGWSFPLNTFLYGMWLDEYDLNHLESRYSIEGVDFEVIGELTDEELAQVIQCFRNSSIVKRKYKRMLQ